MYIYALLFHNSRAVGLILSNFFLLHIGLICSSVPRFYVVNFTNLEAATKQTRQNCYVISCSPLLYVVVIAFMAHIM